ncbi:hypothetical protein GZH53_14675 [Flavihumibacter sp. R14]|nr:hypothetical protein [Flavihumibacter soli]
MIIDIVPVWVLFLVSIAIVLISVEIGFRLGSKVRLRKYDERESPASAISGVILGLQAFMLAFTFSIVSDRYDIKKELVREEANAIRTTWHRADFLPEPDQGKTKELLKEYLKHRVTVGQVRDPEVVRKALGDAIRMQQQLWEIAVIHGKTDLNSDIGALFVESVNEIADLHAMRVNVGLQSRIPSTIWAVLLSLLILGMLGVGYHTAIAESRRSRVTPVLAISFSLVIALIAALDHPGDKLMPVTQQPLINVLREMNAGSGVDTTAQPD